MQDDFERVQSMVELKQKEVESQALELDVKLKEMKLMSVDIDSLHSQVDNHERESVRLNKEVHQKQFVIDEKEEEIYELTTRVERLVCHCWQYALLIEINKFRFNLIHDKCTELTIVHNIHTSEEVFFMSCEIFSL